MNEEENDHSETVVWIILFIRIVSEISIEIEDKEHKNEDCKDSKEGDKIDGCTFCA